MTTNNHSLKYKSTDQWCSQEMFNGRACMEQTFGTSFHRMKRSLIRKKSLCQEAFANIVLTLKQNQTFVVSPLQNIMHLEQNPSQL